MIDDAISTGTTDLTSLAPQWQLLDSGYRTLQSVGARPSPIFHARMFDEAQIAGHRVYMSVERFLAIARDNHRALVSLLGSAHGLSLSAPWNLLRATFEASFYAAWILDPEDGIERRQRALRVEVMDEREHALYYKDLLPVLDEGNEGDASLLQREFAKAAARNEAVYRREAVEMGLSYPPAGPKILEELSRLSCARDGEHEGVMFQAIWKALSGLAHCRIGAYLRASDKSASRSVPGGFHAVLSVNDDYFLSIAGAVNTLHLEAVQLLLRRSQP
ncbi:hypothetical protein [Nocardioides sp. MH1]|uniref:hypothetical protein n=1 Tax=Nocardioides sp. MH1 TaxID=3242490 RepID=UPI0035223A6C